MNWQFNRKKEDDEIKTFAEVTGYQRVLTDEQKLFAETGEYDSEQSEMSVCDLCGGLVPLASFPHPHQ